MVTKKNSRSPWAWIPTLYFAEGLPNVIVTALSVVMYMQLGLTDAEVGLYTGWLALPWVIKPLWSPFIDLLKTKRWWVLTMQALIGAALAGIAFSLPTAFWFQATMCFFFLIAFCSATHDISADGFYMIELDEHTQTKFVGLRNTFYRLAIIFVNGFLVMLAGVLQVVFRNRYASRGRLSSTDWQASSSVCGSTTAASCRARRRMCRPTERWAKWLMN